MSSALLLMAASLGVCLLALELGVRLLVPEAHWRFRDGTYDWRLDPDLGWFNLPSLDVVSRTNQGLVRFQTNPDGLLPPEAQRERRPGVGRILLLGDSFTVGRALPREASYAARLEALLRERGHRVEVINAGVLGYSTDQVLLLMRRLLPQYRPDLVVYGFTKNDLGGNSLRRANGQGKPMFRLRADGTLELLPPQLADRIEPLGGGPGVWIQHSALYRWLQPRLLSLRARLGGWEERQLLGVADEIFFQPAALDAGDWELLGALLAAMREEALAAGARFAFFSHPEVEEVWNEHVELTRRRFGLDAGEYDQRAVERRLLEVAARSGVAFVPAIDYFLARQSRGPFHLLPTDRHLNAVGHELVAELLASEIEARGWLPPSIAAAGSGEEPGQPDAQVGGERLSDRDAGRHE